MEVFLLSEAGDPWRISLSLLTQCQKYEKAIRKMHFTNKNVWSYSGLRDFLLPVVKRKFYTWTVRDFNLAFFLAEKKKLSGITGT